MPLDWAPLLAATTSSASLACSFREWEPRRGGGALLSSRPLPGATQGTWLLSLADLGYFYSPLCQEELEWPVFPACSQTQSIRPSLILVRLSRVLHLRLFFEHWSVYLVSKCSFGFLLFLVCLYLVFTERKDPERIALQSHLELGISPKLCFKRKLKPRKIQSSHECLLWHLK